jgi:hypothetical protein
MNLLCTFSPGDSGNSGFSTLRRKPPKKSLNKNLQAVKSATAGVT